MFTGLVQQIGHVEVVDPQPEGKRLTIACAFDRLNLGESIAVHGVCLTVSEIVAGGFIADASTETLDKSMLGTVNAGDRVHLERALLATDRLGGHLVTGHVDGVGSFAGAETRGDYQQTRFLVPQALVPFVAPKGAITVNGVSLTVNGVHQDSFDVMLVPHTLAETTFGQLTEGDPINLEVDILAKYVASALGNAGVDGSGAR